MNLIAIIAIPTLITAAIYFTIFGSPIDTNFMADKLAEAETSMMNQFGSPNHASSIKDHIHAAITPISISINDIFCSVKDSCTNKKMTPPNGHKVICSAEKACYGAEIDGDADCQGYNACYGAYIKGNAVCHDVQACRIATIDGNVCCTSPEACTEVNVKRTKSFKTLSECQFLLVIYNHGFSFRK